MRTLLLFTALLLLSDHYLSAQNWSLSLRAGRHYARGTLYTGPEYLLQGGEGWSRELAVYRHTKNDRWSWGVTFGHFQLYGLTRAYHITNGISGCFVGATSPPGTDFSRIFPLLPGLETVRQNYWSVLPVLRYRWVGRRWFSLLSLGAGTVYQAAFVHTNVLSDAESAPPVPVERISAPTSFNLAARGELAVGYRLNDRLQLSVYSNLNWIRLRTERTSHDLQVDNYIDVSAYLPMYQIQYGLATTVFFGSGKNSALRRN